MLIVGREIGQSVIIDDEIKVTVIQKNSKLHLVIDSPNSTQVTKLEQSPSTIRNTKKRTSKLSETVLIGEKVKVTILQTESGLLRFAIDAPREISVFREEIYQSNNGASNKSVKIGKEFDFNQANYHSI